jgi:hypothetical protein
MSIRFLQKWLVVGVIIVASSTVAHAFSARIAWGPGAACSAQAPQIVLSKVPAGTKAFDARMVDLNMPSFDHGGGKIEFTGKTSFAPGEAFGFFSTYRGPCPPRGSVHRYQWTINALDGAGKIIGTARAVLPFQS